MRFFALASAIVLTAATLVAADDAPAPSTQPTTQEASNVPPVLNFTMKSLDGREIKLSHYYGRVILIVNTASKCGNTKQYGPLEALHEKYVVDGLSILGFPSNDFGKQEPGTDQDISAFCTKNYGVKFDMFSKVDVNGDSACGLYNFLTSPDTDPKFAGRITWNFEKFLIGRDGTIVARFSPKTQPNSPAVIAAIETELAKPQPVQQ